MNYYAFIYVKKCPYLPSLLIKGIFAGRAGDRMVPGEHGVLGHEAPTYAHRTHCPCQVSKYSNCLGYKF